MIPPPPPDPILPGMSMAWDGDAIGVLLNRAFSDVTVRSCEPYYIKYKPERYCRVQYRVELEDKGLVFHLPAHVSLYPPRRIEKLAARHGLQKNGSYPRMHAAHLRELAAIAQFFPVDFGLPGLAEATSAKAMARRFESELEGRAGCALYECGVELVRYKADKRAVLRYRLHGTPMRAVYGKLRRDGGGSLSRVAGSLARAGVPMPQPLTYLADLQMFVQAEGPGARLAGLRDSSEYEEWMPAVAETLVRLHEAEVEGLPRYSASAEAADLQAAANSVAVLLPHLGADVRSLARRLATRLSAIEGDLVPTHGSFHDDQVLVDDSGVTLIDLDGASVANPWSDVGHFLSYLSAQGAEEAHERFLSCYRSARPGKGDDHLVFEAASLLRWATLPFRELRLDWPEAVERRVSLARARLDAP